MHYYKTILCLFLFLSAFVKGQETVYKGNPDSSFFTARNLAFAGNREEARDTLYSILSQYPDYTDVRTLLAKTYTWDTQYDTARKHFNTILSKNKEIKEVWVAAINNELYSQNYPTALGLSNKALRYIGEDVDIQKQKQQAIAGITTTKENESAIDTAATSFSNQLGIGTRLEFFDIVYEPMFYSSVEYQRKTAVGPIIPRINYSNRFNTDGLQYEVDFYPKFSKLFYAYLNYGFSNASIYSKHRAGAELYLNHPKNMEFSLGMRYLDFTSIKATILTASASLYSGNYLFTARPYVTAIGSNNLGFSGSLSAKKYLKDASNYWGVTGVVGYASELKQLRNAEDALLAETIFYIESQQLILEYQGSGKKSANTYKTTVGITRQELLFNPGNYVWSVSAGLKYNLNF